MRSTESSWKLAALVSIVTLSVSCAGGRQLPDCMPKLPEPQPSPPMAEAVVIPAEIVEIPVVVIPKMQRRIPADSTFVISEIDGPENCAEEVKDALMRRLIDNGSYSIVTRDNLSKIIREADLNYTEGRFDTRTAARIGALLGASYFIVGKVSYCGPGEDEEGVLSSAVTHILAELQILSSETGEVLLSSAAEGTYRPTVSQRFELDPMTRVADNLSGVRSSATPSGELHEMSSSEEIVDSSVLSRGEISAQAAASLIAQDGLDVHRSKPKSVAIGTVEIPMREAADSLAGQFAVKFFARPDWKRVAMWNSPGRRHAKSLHWVKLGRCPLAVEHFEESNPRELAKLAEVPVELARYAHNYGVALLCAGDVKQGMEKLRSAYRIDEHEVTLQMLEFAAKLDEWSLEIEVDRQREVDVLLEYQKYSGWSR